MEILGNLAGMTGKAAGQGGFSDTGLPAAPGAFLRQLQGALEEAEFRAELPLALPRGTADCILPCDMALVAQQVQSLIAATPQPAVAPEMPATAEMPALMPGAAVLLPNPAVDVVASDPGQVAEVLSPKVMPFAAGPEEGMAVPIAADTTLATEPEHVLVPKPELVAQPSAMVVADTGNESLAAKAESEGVDAVATAKPSASAEAQAELAAPAPAAPAPAASAPQAPSSAAELAKHASLVGPQPPAPKSMSPAVPLSGAPGTALINAPAFAGLRSAVAEAPGPRVLAPRAKLAGETPALPLQPAPANGGLSPLSPAPLVLEPPKTQAPVGEGAFGTPAPLAAAATPPNAAPPQILPPPQMATVPMQQPDWPEGLVAGPISALLDAAGGDMVLDITPEDLGRMTISLSVQGDMATVRILTETPEAARLLLEAERQLANELARFGMSLAGHEASADRHGHGPQGRAGRGAGSVGADLPDAASPVPLNARLVNLIA